MKNPLYQLLIILFLFSSQIKAYDLYLKPYFGYNKVTDKNLKGYLATDNFNSFGLSSDIIFNKFSIGCFFDYSRFSFNAEETISGKDYKDKISGDWFVFGISKHFDIEKIPVKFIIKIGSTLHLNSYSNDIYERSNFKDIGLYENIEMQVKLRKNIYIGLGISHANIDFPINNYVNSQFTRHCSYLSGKKIDDPNIQYNISLLFKLPVN